MFYDKQLFSPPPQIVPFEIMRKILWSRTRYRWEYGACALRAGYLRLHIRRTHLQCVILVTFRLQQWLHKRVYAHCLSSLTETESVYRVCCSVQAVKFGLQMPYFASGSYSLSFHGWRLDSIPGHSMWHLLSTKGYKDNFFPWLLILIYIFISYAVM